MTVIKDDWEKPRSHGKPLTPEEIRRVRTSFNQGRHAREIARELQCSTRIINKYYAQFRGGPMRHQRFRELARISKPAPAPATPQPRFYKSNFEL